jgi:hypothetical protein
MTTGERAAKVDSSAMSAEWNLDVYERARLWQAGHPCPTNKALGKLIAGLADEIERLRTDLSILGSLHNDLRAATGGLTPELVAKALTGVSALNLTDLTPDEWVDLRAATFEVTPE